VDRERGGPPPPPAHFRPQYLHKPRFLLVGRFELVKFIPYTVFKFHLVYLTFSLYILIRKNNPKSLLTVKNIFLSFPVIEPNGIQTSPLFNLLTPELVHSPCILYIVGKVYSP
jgi:hypothetical protein